MFKIISKFLILLCFLFSYVYAAEQKSLIDLDKDLRKFTQEAVEVAYKVRAFAQEGDNLAGNNLLEEGLSNDYAFLDPVVQLEGQIECNKNLKKNLLASLTDANNKAKKFLKKELYQALTWPLDCNGYIQYLKEFVTLIPHQSGNPAWKVPGMEDHYQEFYDRICHFYWLIGQRGKPLQNDGWFKEWLVDFNKKWGSFLDTPLSFGKKYLDSFKKHAPKYRVDDSMLSEDKPNIPSGWLTFNQFFARELNPGLRPIASLKNNRIITTPADCTFKEQFDIKEDSSIGEIILKGTHKYANVRDLLKGSGYENSFAGGKFVHYFLAPYSYHRFHAPVSGIVKKSIATQGDHYLQVNIKDDQFDAPDAAQGGYQFKQARGIIIIDTKDSEYGNVGVVAVVPVGMAHVSSVNMLPIENKPLLKGDQFGYFTFGGSDIIALFQKNIIKEIETNTNYHHYGDIIAIAK